MGGAQAAWQAAKLKLHVNPLLRGGDSEVREGPDHSGCCAGNGLQETEEAAGPQLGCPGCVLLEEREGDAWTAGGGGGGRGAGWPRRWQGQRDVRNAVYVLTWERRVEASGLVTQVHRSSLTYDAVMSQ